MKLKIKIKKPNNLLCEVQAAKIAKLRASINRPSDNEKDIIIAYQKALSANNPPKEFFEDLGELSSKLYSQLQKVNNTFPGLGDILSIVKDVSNAVEKDSETVENVADAEEELMADRTLEEERPSESEESAVIDRHLDRGERNDSRRRRRRIGRAALSAINFSNLADSLKANNLGAARKSFLKSIGSGFKALAKQGADPVQYVSKQPQVLLDLRGVFISIALLVEFQKTAVQIRNNIAGIYRQGLEDLESATSEETYDDERLLNNFKLEFKKFDVPKIIKSSMAQFDNSVLASLFGASDTVGGNKFKDAQAAAAKAGDYASSLEDAPNRMTESKLRGANMSKSNMVLEEASDPEFEEAMGELQSDPLTQTFEEYQRQAEQELKQAASDEKIKNLSKVAALIIRAFASYKKLRKERRADFARRFLDKARDDYNEAESQLERMVFLIKEPLGDLLEKYIDGKSGIKEKLINLRKRVKDSKNAEEIPPERATEYIKIINDTLIKFAKLRKLYAEEAKKTIDKNPDEYLEFLEDVESWLKTRTKKIVENLKQNFEQIKSGQTPESEEPEEGDPTEETDPNALKNLPVGKVNVALNQLRQKGISSKELASQIEDIIQAISRGAGPQRRNFEERDVPVINKIKDELIKILSGDFSNLLKENKFYLKVHAKTYKIINMLALGKF